MLSLSLAARCSGASLAARTTRRGFLRSLSSQAPQRISSNDIALPSYLPSEVPRTSLLMELSDRIGVLSDVLRYFWKNDVNISRIESRPVQVSEDLGHPKFDFFVDFDGSPHDPNVARLLEDLRMWTDKLLILDEKQVHWFPRHVSELDLVANRTLDAGVELEADHPGFHDRVGGCGVIAVLWTRLYNLTAMWTGLSRASRHVDTECPESSLEPSDSSH